MENNERVVETFSPSFSPDILPDTRLKNTKNVQFHLGMNWVPIFCANCGADGGFVPEENCNFAFYLCQTCADKLPPIPGTYVEPDQVFWQKLNEVQLEEFGRVLTGPEIERQLQDESSTISKLAKGR